MYEGEDVETPPTVTVNGPEVPPVGTLTVIDVLLQLTIGQRVLFNFTVLFVPWVEPKLTPAKVTHELTIPEVGDILPIRGAVVSVKLEPLLVVLLTFTVTFPEVAAAGTGTTMDAELQLVGLPVAPVKLMLLELPCEEPKFAPRIVTGVVIGPLEGYIPAMNGEVEPFNPLTTGVASE